MYEFKVPSQDEWDNGNVIKGADAANPNPGGNNYWVQLGSDIDGEAGDRSCGETLSLSSDGSIVAIGSYFNDAGSSNVNDNRGHVRVYKYINSSWTQLGSDIDGEAANDLSGYSVSLSKVDLEDGTTQIRVAIGAQGADRVQVYEYN